MAKLYKSMYTQEDLLQVTKYIHNFGMELFIEIWVDGSDDGNVYPIDTDLVRGIDLTNRYYDSLSNRRKCAELILRERDGSLTALYHIERNKSGLTYEVLNYAKRL